MTTITITVDGKAAQDMLSRIVPTVVSDKTMRQMSLAMKQQVYNAFRFQRAPDGKAWPGLSPLTLARRAKRGNHSIQPLIDTGAMYASIEPANTASEASVTMGVAQDARAIWNQFGTSRAPARPVFPMTESAVNLTQAWLDGVVLAPVRDAFDRATS